MSELKRETYLATLLYSKKKSYILFVNLVLFLKYLMCSGLS